MKYIKSFKFWIFFIVLVYTFVGFFFLPWFITQKVPNIIKDKTGINISIEKAHFNPYTFELQLSNIAVDDLKKQLVFKLKNFYVNYTIFGLLDKTFLFSSVTVDSPTLYALIDKHGNINLNNILPKKEREQKSQNSEKTSLPSILVRKIDIKNGQIKIKDDRENKKFKVDLGPYNFMAHDISTKRGELNAYSFETLINDESKLSWRGGMSIEPLKLYGRLTLKDLKLPKIYKYVLPDIDSSLETGSLWLTLPYQIDISKKIRFRIDHARVHLVDIKLKEKKSSKILLNARNIKVNDFNLDWPKQDILIENFKISDTDIYPKLLKNSKLNFAEAFFIKTEKKSDTNRTKTAKSWSYLLKNAKIARTNIYFDNQNMKKETKTALTQISLHVKNISSNKQSLIGYKLSSNLNNSSNISISGNIIQKPLSTISHLKLTNILPTDFINYLDPYINFKLKSASIDAQVDINATFEKNLNLEAVSSSSLNNLVINSKDGKELVNFQKFAINGLDVKFPKQSIAINNISLTKAFINAKLEKNGDVNLLKAFVATDKKKQNKKESKKIKPWKFLIKNTNIDRSTIAFLDKTVEIPTKSRLSNISLHVKNISSNQKSPIKYTLKSRLNKKTDIKLLGKVVQKPLLLSSKIDLKRINVVDFTNYFSSYINFKLKDAYIDLSGNIEANLGKNPKIKLYLNTSVNSLLINSQDNKKLLKWKKLSINGIKFQNSPMAISIKTVNLDKPYIRAHIAKNRSTNFSNLIKKSQEKTEKKEKWTHFKLKIGDIKLVDGMTDFSDASLPFPFHTNIHDLNGYITTLDFDSTTPSKLKLDGKIDRYGYADIKGVLLPFKIKQKADIDVLLKNINLSSLTPYSGKFLGYKIKNGKLSMDLNYKISQASLIGKNKINIDTLDLGESVKSKDAVNLPLKLALALLKDSNNQIDINLPVSGDMNNPDFSYGGIVWKAIGHMITGIVTAPFKFLGSILGIKGEDLKAIDFESGSYKIISSEVEKLDNLNKIMGKRPNIKLEIMGGYNKTIDAKALQNQKIEKLINLKLVKLKKETNATKVDNYGKVLKNLYIEKFSAPKYTKLKQKFTILQKVDDNKNKKQKVKTKIVLDITAFNTKMQKELAQAIKIPKSELISLANKRANAIKNMLTKRYKIDKARLKILTPKAKNAKRDRWIECALKIGI